MSRERVLIAKSWTVVVIIALIIISALLINIKFPSWNTTSNRVIAAPIGSQYFLAYPPPYPAPFTFLPYVIKAPPQGIYGIVTYNGNPAVGVPITLRFYNGSSWSTSAETSTSEDGIFVFTNIPSLGGGQKYYVRYINTDNSAFLWYWETKEITSFTQGESLHIGDFDIADVTLSNPPGGSTSGFPSTFSWNRRDGSPADSYELNIGDLTDYDPYFYSQPPLGYVNSYTLQTLPPNFKYGTAYLWFIAIYSPDGGYGESYYARYVSFQSGGYPTEGISQEKSIITSQAKSNPRIHESTK